jgi:hypothetical protein
VCDRIATPDGQSHVGAGATLVKSCPLSSQLKATHSRAQVRSGDGRGGHACRRQCVVWIGCKPRCWGKSHCPFVCSLIGVTVANAQEGRAPHGVALWLKKNHVIKKSASLLRTVALGMGNPSTRVLASSLKSILIRLALLSRHQNL